MAKSKIDRTWMYYTEATETVGCKRRPREVQKRNEKKRKLALAANQDDRINRAETDAETNNDDGNGNKDSDQHPVSFPHLQISKAMQNP